MSVLRQLVDRRRALQAGLCAALWASPDDASALDADQKTSDAQSPPRNVRSGWIDAHVHVWTPDIAQYPLAQGYAVADMQPASFTPEELMSHAAPCGVTRVVLIQMSFYGFDNRYMLDTIAQAPDTYRGVAVIDSNNKPRRAMKELASKGVRGFRLRPETADLTAWTREEGWRAMWSYGGDARLAMCLLIDANQLPSVAKMCHDFRQTPVVIDHFARIGVDGQVRTSDLDNLCRLAEFEHVTVKISAYYALGLKEPPYRDLGGMIERLMQAFGRERLMWASDCPYQVQGRHSYAASIDLIRSELRFLTPEDREWLLRKSAERQFFGET